MRDSRWCIAVVSLGCAVLAAGPARARDLRAGLPPIVFVARTPAAGADAGQVPGLGPQGTFVIGRGELLERAPDGSVRSLVARERLLDVADPDVSPDGHRVAFSGVAAPGARWRIWVVERTGGALRCETCSRSEADTLYDDADPCWWGDSLVFVSTRAGGRALYDGTPVTQLWLRTPDGTRVQLTHEPNGALDPVRDPRTKRLVFARWWFNPWVSERTRGLTRDPAHALTPDSVNLWQVVSVRLTANAAGLRPALTDIRLAAGGTVPRRRGMGVQPAPLPGGGMLAVSARNTGLAPRPGTLSLQRYAAAPSGGARIAGAAIGDDAGDPYAESANLAAPAACAPVALPDGRVLHALDPSGRGDFGLWLVTADGMSRSRLRDSPGKLELDPAVVPARRVAHARPPGGRRDSMLGSATQLFTYMDIDVFAGEGGPARQEDAHLHVFRLVNADSIEQLLDVSVPASGRIQLRLPADTPLFEQLTDSNGRALMSAHGPAQVRGFNSGAAGSTARCVGCHLGHSARPPR